MATNKGDIAEYFGIDLVPKPGLPTIMVPTTAGTGSEVTPIAILSDEKEKLKKLEGSLLAGMAFANAGVTAVHAFAYPIGAEFHIPHGVANTLMLPHVMRFNLLGNLGKFAEIAEAFCLFTEGLDELTAAEISVDAIQRLAEDLRVPKHLAEFGTTEGDLSRLAEGVMKVTRLLANNPRALTLEDAKEIYKKPYKQHQDEG